MSLVILLFSEKDGIVRRRGTADFHGAPPPSRRLKFAPRHRPAVQNLRPASPRPGRGGAGRCDTATRGSLVPTT